MTYDSQFYNSAFAIHTLLNQASHAVTRAMEYQLAEMGLSPEKLAVLWICRDYPGTLTITELSRLVFRKQQTVTGLINRMENEGLIKRIPKRRGHPFTEILLTAKGEETIGLALPVHKALIEESAFDFSAEQREHLQKSLRALRDRALERLPIKPKLARVKPIRLKW